MHESVARFYIYGDFILSLKRIRTTTHRFSYLNFKVEYRCVTSISGPQWRGVTLIFVVVAKRAHQPGQIRVHADYLGDFKTGGVLTGLQISTIF